MKYIYGSFHVKRLGLFALSSRSNLHPETIRVTKVKGLFALSSRSNLHPETIRVTKVKGQGASLQKTKQNTKVFFLFSACLGGTFCSDLRCPGSQVWSLTGKTVPSGHYIVLNFIYFFFDVDHF